MTKGESFSNVMNKHTFHCNKPSKNDVLRKVVSWVQAQVKVNRQQFPFGKQCRENTKMMTKKKKSMKMETSAIKSKQKTRKIERREWGNEYDTSQKLATGYPAKWSWWCSREAGWCVSCTPLLLCTLTPLCRPSRCSFSILVTHKLLFNACLLFYICLMLKN